MLLLDAGRKGLEDPRAQLLLVLGARLARDRQPEHAALPEGAPDGVAQAALVPVVLLGLGGQESLGQLALLLAQRPRDANVDDQAPRPPPRRDGIPRPRSTLTSPGWVPALSSSDSGPSSVSISRVTPSMASAT